MSDSRLVDENGCLLPPEQCNIKPLHCLTKDRAPNPARRLPSSKNGKERPEDKQNTQEPLNFVQEPNQTKRDRLILSQTALKPSSSLDADSKTNIILSIRTPESGSNEKIQITSREAGKNKRFKKMKSSDENSPEEIELSDKPIEQWSSEEVCLWLDYVNLSKLKEHFKSQSVTGQILIDLNYETLERLQLGNASKEREHFLGAVYELQQEHEHEVKMEDNKENEDAFQGEHEHSQNEKAATNSQTTNEVTSSSHTSNEHATTANDHHTTVTEKKVPQSDNVTANSQNKMTKTTAKQTSLTKTTKKTSKQGDKKRKSSTKRISRFWSSFHGSKNSTVVDSPSGPFYKNVFHNLMEVGPQGVIKIWTEMFLTDMQYVSLLVRRETSASEAVKMVLEKSNAQEDPESYRICEINEEGNEYILDNIECPLQRERKWADPDHCRFELRWSNERLIEWDRPSTIAAVQDVSFEKPLDDEKPAADNKVEGLSDSSPTSTKSPVSDDLRRYIETAFDYETSSAGKVGSSSSTEEKAGEMGDKEGSQNDLLSEELGSLLRAHKNKFSSSCPDLTSNDLFENNLEVSSLSDDTGVDDFSTTFDDELKYSQRLRTSSKNLSGRLKFKTEKSEVQTAFKGDNHEHTGDSVDGAGKKTVVENGDVITKSVHEDHHRAPGDQNGEISIESKIGASEDLGSGDKSAPEVSQSDTSQEVERLTERVKEVENDNASLVEENRELKKSCRTFEGKSRLKERELEEMEGEKNEIASQMHETVDDLHNLRLENSELRTSLAEANTKLGDVDGWVTRETFEDIRGQLSLSLEEIEQREETVRDLEKKANELKTENKKIEVLENEVQELKDKMKESENSVKEKVKESKEKTTKIQGFESQVSKLRSSIKKRDEEKDSLVKKLEETQQELADGSKNHSNEKKDLQKRMSDKEYEILIMKEEKKELCVKLKGLESNVENIQEEMKKKEGEHEAVVAELNEQSDIKDQSLSITVTNLEELVTERDMRIKQLKKQLAEVPQNELKAKEHQYEQNKLYLKHLVALVKKKDPKLLDQLNKTLKSKDVDDWC